MDRTQKKKVWIRFGLDFSSPKKLGIGLDLAKSNQSNSLTPLDKKNNLNVIGVREFYYLNTSNGDQKVCLCHLYSYI